MTKEFSTEQKQIYDAILIGAGPAGLMAAIASHQPGRKICILEKMPLPALKLKISGKGRCNITNAAERRDFLSHFGPNSRFLKPAFANFFNTDLISFFESLGIRFKLERGGRWFPQSDDAHEIVRALLGHIRNLGITLQTRSAVADISPLPDGELQVTINNGSRKTGAPETKTLIGKRVVLATGGKSYPKTGSDGSGYQLAARLGHTITPLFPSLVALHTAGDTARRLEGLSLKNVAVTLWIDDKKMAEEFGEMVFTADGVSGPIVLSLSRQAVRILQNGQRLSLAIDFKPALDHPVVDARLLREIRQHSRQQFKSLLEGLLPRKLIPVFLDHLQIEAQKPLHQITAEERKNLRLLLKVFRLEITGHASFDQAIVTSGGIALSEVNPQTLESKRVPGLFFAGEILDIDADTGGFNLQAAFSTGRLAGKAL